MLKDKIMAACILCLAISFIISANIIADGIKDCGASLYSGCSAVSQGLSSIASTMNNNIANGQELQRNTIDLQPAAEYLGITEESLIKIVKNKKSGIPYIKMGEFYLFDKDALKKWLETARVEVE